MLSKKPPARHDRPSAETPDHQANPLPGSDYNYSWIFFNYLLYYDE
jgi:hypothetical protein